jgi:CRP/FNR family cyclic AMP-dependent transcriptional regulator
MFQDLGVLPSVPLLAGLDHDRLHRLAARSTVRTVAAGCLVAIRGQPCTHLIVVEAGVLTSVHDTVDGQRRRLGEFTAPCAVDKVAVLDSGGHTATWLAATRSRLRLIPSGELLAIIDNVPAARRHVLVHLARCLRDRQDDLVCTSFADASGRTAAWLARAASRTGTRIILPGAQQGLAEAIGMTRVSVNRALRKLAREGLIRVEPGAVVVLAPELLALRANRSLDMKASK